MIDLLRYALVLAGLPVWVWVLYCWSRRWEHDLVLAAALVFERLVSGPEPAPEMTAGRLVRDLTVKDTRWGRANYPATHPVYEWVVPT